MEYAQFEQVLLAVQGIDNVARQQAEAIMANVKTDPNLFVNLLMTGITKSESVVVRQLAPIILRNDIVKGDETLWPLLGDETKFRVKSELVVLVEHETDVKMRKIICDTIGDLAAGILQNNEWPELIPFLLQWSRSNQSTNHRINAFLILAQIQFLNETMVPHYNDFQATLAENFQCQDIALRCAVFKALSTCVPFLEPAWLPLFQPLLVNMMDSLMLALQTNQEQSCRTLLDYCSDIAAVSAQFFRADLDSWVNALCEIANMANLNADTCSLAVEVLVTLCENAGGMMRKLPGFVDRLIPILLMMMLKIEDDIPQWNSRKDDPEVGTFDAAVDFFFTLTKNSDIAQVMRVLDCHLPTALDNPDWRFRHAALTALTQIGESVDWDHTLKLTPIFLAYFEDPDPRVRHAAVNAVSNYSVDFETKFQNHFHPIVMPALCARTGDAAPRVQYLATFAILNMVENFSDPAESMALYLDPVMQHLMRLMQSDVKFVVEQAIHTTGYVGSAVGSQFSAYYAQIVPFLKKVLTEAVSKEDIELRSKALECWSLLGVSVGSELFSQDVDEMAEFLKNVTVAVDDQAGMMTSYVLQAWARICQVVGDRFAPYLQYVMPTLIAAANQQAEVVFMSADDLENMDPETIDEGLEVLAIGDTRICIKTSVLEEKATACRMLTVYMESLKASFFPFLQDARSVLVPLVQFYADEETRTIAVTAMPELLRCAVAAYKKELCTGGDVGDLLTQVLDNILPALKKEPNSQLRVHICDALRDIINICEHGCLNDTSVMGEVLATLMKVLNDSRERIQRRLGKSQHQDHDQHEDKAMQKNEQARRPAPSYDLPGARRHHEVPPRHLYAPFRCHAPHGGASAGCGPDHPRSQDWPLRAVRCGGPPGAWNGRTPAPVH